MEADLWQKLKEKELEDSVPFVTYADRVGRQEGLKDGLQREKLQGGIETSLDMKFGSAGVALMPQVEAITDLALLQRILDACKNAASLEDVVALLPAPPS